jgi:CRP/FNR family cyclic AMP-dependent transcriptional regulator
MCESGSFWTQLSPAERELLRSIGRVRDYLPGEAIIQEISEDRHAVILLAGRGRVATVTRNGKEAILALRGPGDIVGELPALDGGPRSATVVAVGRTRGLVLSPEGLRSVLQQHPRVMNLMTALVAQRLREADRRRVELSTAGVLSRTASVILEYAEALTDGSPPVRLDIISQVDLAGLIGTSRESVGRALAGLRDRGVVTTARGAIIVLDLGRLRAVAEP